MNYSFLTYKIAMSLLRPMSLSVAGEILRRFGSIEEFFNADTAQLINILGSGKITRKKLDDALAKAVDEEKWVESNGVKPIFFTDDNYPKRLLDCDDAPLMLYMLGETNLNSAHVISIVGTRHATAYGLSFVSKFITELREMLSDVLIVSGLAYGIDVSAHKESLLNDIPTIGVVAHGLSTIYPASHRDIAARMVKNGGGLVTEYIHDAFISKGNFLARNRIVAGICDALIVVETAEKGGSLVTAKLAAAYGRPVFALPGRTTDTYSCGCNRLISNNSASLLIDAADFARAMMWKVKEPSEGVQQSLFPELSPQQKLIYDYLVKEGEATINSMAEALGFSISELMQTIGDMEFDDILISIPGSKYRINKTIQ